MVFVIAAMITFTDQITNVFKDGFNDHDHAELKALWNIHVL